MELNDAAALIAPAVPAPAPGGAPAHWLDLGAGRGTFTRALARLLGPAGRVAAVDRDPAAVAALAALARSAPGGAVTAHRADLADPAALDALLRALGRPPVAGVLLANALHFVPAAAQAAVVADLAARLAPGGRLVLVEYEGRRAGPWVPAPVPPDAFRALAAAAGVLGAPVRVGARPSAFGGTLYAAYAERGPRPAPPAAPAR